MDLLAQQPAMIEYRMQQAQLREQVRAQICAVAVHFGHIGEGFEGKCRSELTSMTRLTYDSRYTYLRG